jgi:hypothetical protein
MAVGEDFLCSTWCSKYSFKYLKSPPTNLSIIHKIYVLILFREKNYNEEIIIRKSDVADAEET